MSELDKVTPPPWDGQPYSVKRHGVTLTNCDSEPVQTPGCVQAHGAMLVLRPADLTILQASENTDRLLGHRAESLLNKPIRAAVGLDGEASLKAFLATEPTDRNPLYAFTLPARGDVPPLDVTVHTIDGVAVVELEATGRTGVGEPDYYALVKRFANAPSHQKIRYWNDQRCRRATRTRSGRTRLTVGRHGRSPCVRAGLRGSLRR